jgi:hypothetical protein
MSAGRTHAEVLLGETRQELEKADNKAATLLAVVGLIVTLTFGVALDKAWNPLDYESNLASALVIAGAGAVLVSLLLTLAALKPRTKHTGLRQGLTYFGDVAAYDDHKDDAKNIEDLKAQLLVHNKEDSFDRLVDQVWHLSRIVRTKYALINLSVILAMSAPFLLLAGLVAEASR